MLGLPQSALISRQLPKTKIFDKFKDKFKSNPEDRKLFDEQINRLAFVAEISPQSVNISVGESVAAIYVIRVSLKTPECNKRNISLLSRLVKQNMLFTLEFDGKARLVVCYSGKVFQTATMPLADLQIKLSGNNLDTVWENIIADIGEIEVAEELTLAEQIAVNEERRKLLDKIDRLVKKARTENQPRKKLEYAEEVQKLKRELEENSRYG